MVQIRKLVPDDISDRVANAILSALRQDMTTPYDIELALDAAGFEIRARKSLSDGDRCLNAT